MSSIQKKEVPEMCEAAAKSIKSDRKIQREEGYRYRGSSNDNDGALIIGRLAV